MATSKKTAKKKTAKKTAKSEKKPFSTKAKKGFVTVHVLARVSPSGQVDLDQPNEHESLESAIENVQMEPGETYHHLTTVLPLPKPATAKRSKLKSKLVGASAPAPSGLEPSAADKTHWDD